MPRYNSAVLFAIPMCLLPIAHCQAEQPKPSRVSVLIGPTTPNPDAEAIRNSPLQAPFGVDFDRDGRMFIVELEGGRIHERRAEGAPAVISGDGSRSYRGDGGPIGMATFNGMHNLAVSKTGKMYVADTWNHVVREIDLASRQITTFAGTGTAGFSGDGGPAEKAQFHDIMCVSLNPAEDAIFLADLKNRRIRAIDLKTKTVRTAAGNGRNGVPPDGAIAVDSPLIDPRAVAVDSTGRVYVLERGGHALRVVETDGKVRTVAGTGKSGFRDGPAREAQLAAPKHLCVDDQDRVYIADDMNAAIRCYDPATETIATLLGRGHGDKQITLKNPHGVCIERGALYVVDSRNNRILQVEFAP